MTSVVAASDWLLEPPERGNPASLLDSRHPDGRAWTSGNRVRVLIHGATYFAALKASVQQMRRGDLLMYTDWRGVPTKDSTATAAKSGHFCAMRLGRGRDRLMP